MNRVLVVEDYADNNYMLVTLLRSAGFDVLSCGDGIEALAIYTDCLNRQRPLVHAIVDLALPKLDGATVAYIIRRIEHFGKEIPKMRLLAFTAYSNRAKDSRLLEVFDGVKEKPVDPKEILKWLTG